MNETHASKKGASTSRYRALSELPEEEQPAVYDLAKEEHHPKSTPAVQGKRGPIPKGPKKSTSGGMKQKGPVEQGSSQDCLFNSTPYVAQKSTTTLDQTCNAAFQVFDARLPRTSQVLCGPIQGNDPLSKSRGKKLATGVTIHNLGAKPNPNSPGPSVRLMKQLTRDIRNECGALDDVMFDEGVASLLPTHP